MCRSNRAGELLARRMLRAGAGGIAVLRRAPDVLPVLPAVAVSRVALVTGGGRGIDLVEEYDPVTDQWGRLRASMPTARSALAWGVHGGKIYVAGGEHQDTRMFAAFRTVEAFDPAANTWTVMPPMQFPRHGHAGAVIGNRLHIVSGDVQSAASGAVVHVDYHHALDLPSQQ